MIDITRHAPWRGETLAHIMTKGIWYGQIPAALGTPRVQGFRTPVPTKLLHATLADVDRISPIIIKHMREMNAVVESPHIPGAAQRISATLIRVAFGAAVTNLSHSASFHSCERIAPSNHGMKHPTSSDGGSANRLGRIPSKATRLPSRPCSADRPGFRGALMI